MAPASGIHYHRGDYPDTLRLVAELVHPRLTRGDEFAGFQRTAEGYWIDWGELINVNGWSSSERGALVVAQGLAIIERAGGAGPLADSIIDAVASVVR